MEYHRDTAAANPVREGKGGFRKITVSLPPEAYEKLILESTRRKIAQEPNRHAGERSRSAEPNGLCLDGAEIAADRYHKEKTDEKN